MKNLFLKIGLSIWLLVLNQIASAQTYPCAAATTANWQSLGPFNVPQGGIGVGLAVTLACHPTNSNILFASGMNGGMWKSIDKGSTWSKLETNQGYFNQSYIGQIAISKSSPSIMYASTGEGAGFGGGGWAMGAISTGVYKSTDGGLTWNPTGLTGVSTGTNKNWNFGLNNTNYSHVAKLIVHPTNANIAFAAVITRAYWNDVLDSKQGALYKTIDGGTSWTQVIGLTNAPSTPVNTGLGSTYMVDVEFHPTNSNIVYASGHRLYKSTDGGSTWADICNLLPNFQVPLHHVSTIEIAVSQAAPQKLFVVENTPVLPVSANMVINSLLWSYDNTTNTASLVSQYTNTTRYNLVVDPVNPLKMYSGTISYNKPVYRSLDGGINWTLMCSSCNNNPSLHTDVRDIVINPLDGYVYACTDGGISSSPNNEEPAMNVWTFKGNGMAITNPGGFDVSQTDGRLVLATDHNRLILYEPSTNTWRGNNSTGDGNGAIIDANNSNIMYASDGHNSVILKSTDAFLSSTSINFSGSKGEYGIGSIAQHPNNSSLVYVGKTDLWKTTSGEAPRIQLSNFGDNDLIKLICVSPVNDNIIYLFDGWDFRRTSDGGTTWANTARNAFAAYEDLSVLAYQNGYPGDPIVTEHPSYTDITSITAHPNDPNIVWITWKAFGNGSQSTCLYKSTDKGATWTNDALGLPPLPAYSLVIDRESPVGAMYVSTQTGVYYRDNTLSQWQCFSDKLANSEIRKLVIRYPTREIYAALYGRGIWKSPLACPVITQDLYIANSNTPNLNVTKVAHNSISGAKSDVNTSAPLIIASGNNMTLAAGRSVTLLPGFNSQTGAVFKAYASPSLNCDHNNVARKESSLALEINTPALSQAEEVKALPPAVQIVEIYPNPNNGVFKIKTNLKKDEVIESIVIRDVSGTVLKEYKELPPDGSFDVQELLNSHYLIMEIHTNQGKYSDRIVKETRLGEEKDKR